MPDDYYVSQYSGEEIDALLASAGAGTVRYDAAQTLTDAQKTQARGNIEAQNGTFVVGIFDTKGWYRIATGTKRSCGILTVQHSYNNGGPSSLKLLVTLSDDGSSLKCIEYTNYVVSAITSARIVSNASGLCCIDVYYNINGLNTGGIDFISMGWERAECQAPVYIGADDTLPSGETLKATMEYLNPPLVLGVEYRTTERYLGKPVYVKAVNLGALPNATIKTVTHGISSVARCVRCCANFNTGDMRSIPYAEAGVRCDIFGDTNGINVYTPNNLSSITAIGTIWVTKTTD